MIAVKQRDIASTIQQQRRLAQQIKVEFHYAMHSHNNAALPGSVFKIHIGMFEYEIHGMILVDIH